MNYKFHDRLQKNISLLLFFLIFFQFSSVVSIIRLFSFTHTHTHTQGRMEFKYFENPTIQ